MLGVQTVFCRLWPRSNLQRREYLTEGLADLYSRFLQALEDLFGGHTAPSILNSVLVNSAMVQRTKGVLIYRFPFPGTLVPN